MAQIKNHLGFITPCAANRAFWGLAWPPAGRGDCAAKVDTTGLRQLSCRGLPSTPLPALGRAVAHFLAKHVDKSDPQKYWVSGKPSSQDS